MSGTAFCGGMTLGNILSRFINDRVNAGKPDERVSVVKASHIADLSHQLSGRDLTDTVHSDNGIVFGELFSKRDDLGFQGCDLTFERGELLGGSGDEKLCVAVFWQRGNMTAAVSVQIKRFFNRKMITQPLAPFTIPFRKRFFADKGNTVSMPEGSDEINPLLVTVSLIRTCEALVHAGKHLVG